MASFGQGLGKIAKRIFGSANDRYLTKIQPKVIAINALEETFKALSDDALKGKTAEFRARLAQGETLDSLLVEAFATMREAAKRTLGLRHYDVQLIGGMVLHDNSIAEMKTGEGKTLVATLAAYLNALSGNGVHVVTVNDYLAKRDARWMGEVYGFLGLTTGIIVPGLSDSERRDAYACDITYATNNELGFDYLRDNMKFHKSELVQRPFAYAIVDEVDSILIDEARTPLIISGPTDDKPELYSQINSLIPLLGPEDFEKDEKAKNVSLTEEGTEKIEQLLKERDLLKSDNLYDYENTAVVHHVDQALKAHTMFTRDTDYIVKDDKVIIIDEFTGRMMDGRRWSGGLHQAVEAKEGVRIQPENQTLASITFQNFFRLYTKLSGMTGTAATEAEEFAQIYNLGVIEIPTNVPVQRIDEHDEFYRTADEKYTALIAEIETAQAKGQPVLVGTVSIEKSEHLSSLLKKKKIKHQVLNARYHEQEAAIIAEAGRLSAVTIATNMAGRGTDIQLGGNLELRLENAVVQLSELERDDALVLKNLETKIRAEIETEKAKLLEAGGLYVIGTERHESRRIDNQLRGRTGRQGDPGRSKFFLSLHDDLMRIFGPERMDGLLTRLGIQEGEAIIHPWINKAIERAQQKVEARNYDIRKHLVKYDDVMNDQRRVIYEQRREVMDLDDASDTIKDMRHELIHWLVETRLPLKAHREGLDLEGLGDDMRRLFGLELPLAQWIDTDGMDNAAIADRLLQETDRFMASKAVRYGADFWRSVEKSLLLQVIDQSWKEHLSNLDHVRQSVGLRAYGQRDPLNEYKTEAFTLFEHMLQHSREQLSHLLARLELAPQADPEALMPSPPKKLVESHPDPITGQNEMAGPNPNDASSWGNVARNAPCPCGSGQKYKHCHGEMSASEAQIAAAAALSRADIYANTGRNDSCPCGSGKKYKHCHGQL